MSTTNTTSRYSLFDYETRYYISLRVSHASIVSSSQLDIVYERQVWKVVARLEILKRFLIMSQLYLLDYSSTAGVLGSF